MAEKEPVPTKELLAWLERLFPDKLPDTDVSDRELAARIGEQRVIRRLRTQLTKYNPLA